MILDLKEQVFSVLVISASKKFNNSIAEFIPKSRFTPIIFADNVAVAKRVLTDNSFDIVIVNSPLPDENGIDLSIDLCADTNTGVLLFSRSDIYEIVVDKVMPYGVLTLSKPASSKLVLQSVNILCSLRQKLKKFEKKTVSIEEKMKEIRIINRAKWLLIDELKMSEEDAHKYIEKQAMDNCETKRSVSERIIRTYG